MPAAAGKGSSRLGAREASSQTPPRWKQGHACCLGSSLGGVSITLQRLIEVGSPAESPSYSSLQSCQADMSIKPDGLTRRDMRSDFANP